MARRTRTNRLRKRRTKAIKRLHGQMARVSPLKADRIELLRRWAGEHFKVGDWDTPERRREAHNRRPHEAKYGRCWACGELRMVINHHIIQIQHGGSNWHLNIVKICDDCHALIHPWLLKPKLDPYPDLKSAEVPY